MNYRSYARISSGKISVFLMRYLLEGTGSLGVELESLDLYVRDDNICQITLTLTLTLVKALLYRRLNGSLLSLHVESNNTYLLI